MDVYLINININEYKCSSNNKFHNKNVYYYNNNSLT